MGSTESVPCTELLGGAGWATVVVAAGASAEPSLAAVGTAKTKAKSLSAAGEAHLRPGGPSTVVTDAETRGVNLFEEAERSSTLIRGPCVRKSLKLAEVRGNPPKAVLSVRGTSLPKPTPGIGEENVCGPQALMRYMPPPSTGVRLVDPLQSCSVAVSGKRERKSASPLTLPLRYSSVQSNAVRNSSHLWTRALWSPTLHMLSNAF